MEYKIFSDFLLKTICIGAGTVLLFAFPLSCGGDDDSAIDAGTDAGVECQGVCLSSISGHLFFEDGSPAAEWPLQICSPNCTSETTDSEGYFIKEDCFYDFDFENPNHFIHVTVYDNDQDYARYASGYEPTQDEVSDQGADDLDFNVGDLYIYELPSESADYTKAGGATVDLSGVTFDLEAESLIGAFDEPLEDAAIKVFQAPAEWEVPFDKIGMDALYYIKPYYTKIEGGAVLSIEPPDGWVDGDEGTLYMMGDLYNSMYLNKPEGEDTCSAGGYSETNVEISELAECGSAVMTDGKVATAPVPLFGWFGIKK